MDQTLGHYKIVSELGRGGMGVVYKAFEESLNRYVAIKVLGEHLSHDESFVKRFVREARAAAALSHPNVIQIYAIGQEPPPEPVPHGSAARHYFVMEYVEGRSVHDLLKDEGALDPLRAVRIVQQAASGLAAAHDQGLVHRDIKPANLLVTRGEHVKIADFGLALAPSDAGTRLTATHSLMGTPGYLSPEQCCGEPAGPRSDIYSLGMTFYEMLTGAMPFRGESPLAVLRQVLDEDPPPLLEIDPSLDPAIAKVVERMVRKEPNDRYPSCHELLADLAGIGGGMANEPTARLPRSAPAAASPPAAGALPPPPPASFAATAAVSGSAPAAGFAGAPVAAAAPPPPAAATGRGQRWAIIGGMVVMLVIAVSAAGLFLGRTSWRDGEQEEVARGQVAAADASADTRAAGSSEGARGLSGVSPGAPAEALAPASVAPPAADPEEGPREGSPRSDSSALASEASVMSDGPAGDGLAGSEKERSASVDASAPPIARDESGRPAPAADLAASAHGEERRGGAATASRAAAQLAPAGRAPHRAPIRERPRVAVLAIGEPTLASAAEAALEAQLLRHGLDLYDERGILELRDGGGAAGFAPSALVAIAAERGVDVLVLVDAEPLGERELTPLNRRYDYATTSRLRVDAFLTAEGDGIGRGWSHQVEYTPLNAEARATSLMGRVSNELAGEIGAAWEGHRAASSP
ncbi:MAG TPA: serine/threonine-protein kinase [Thermoanaerobaculia bacterium]|nr:serine/threonine-protein kinase [Thermoanaerobaculia bacterium]